MAAAGKRADGRVRVGLSLEREAGKLQADGPTFGALHQLLRIFGLQIECHALVEKGQRLLGV